MSQECMNYNYNWINLKSLMKRSDLEADSTSLKCFKKKDWKSRCIHRKECIKVEDIHSIS